MITSTSTSTARETRLPIPMTDEEIDALPGLTPSEKEVAKGNLLKTPARANPAWALLGNDPDIQAVWHLMEVCTQAMLQPDVQFSPGSPMNLITLQVARLYGSEWQTGAMVNVSAATARDWETEHNFTPAHLGMLAHPESLMWSDEQRLSLRFAQSLMENTMTDELMEEARATWGDKLVMRHTMWTVYCIGWAMFIGMAGIPHVPGTLPTALPQDKAQSLRPYQLQTLEKVKELWKTQPVYGAI